MNRCLSYEKVRDWESRKRIIATYLPEVFQKESGEVCRIGADRGWAVRRGHHWDAAMAALPPFWSMWCMSQSIASMGLSVKSLVPPKLPFRAIGFRARDFDAGLSLLLHTWASCRAIGHAVTWAQTPGRALDGWRASSILISKFRDHKPWYQSL